MSTVYIEGENIGNWSYTQVPLPKGDYENCTFYRCDFSGSPLSEIRFTTCSFTECNLSLSALVNTVFQDTTFTDCKMLGLHFENCSDFGFSVLFKNCVLDQSSFFEKKLKKGSFINCRIHEADFAGCDLSQTSFSGSDLLGTLFENTNLEKADFRLAYNFNIAPAKNRLKKAKFSSAGLIGLLYEYDIEVE